MNKHISEGLHRECRRNGKQVRRPEAFIKGFYVTQGQMAHLPRIGVHYTDFSICWQIMYLIYKSHCSLLLNKLPQITSYQLDRWSKCCGLHQVALWSSSESAGQHSTEDTTFFCLGPNRISVNIEACRLMAFLSGHLLKKPWLFHGPTATGHAM